MEKITGYIQIPNVVANTRGLNANAKYLYGLIMYWSYIDGNFVHTSDELCEELEIKSINTLKKYIRQLEALNYIKIEKINETRKNIIPLISDGMKYEEKRIVRKEREENKTRTDIKAFEKVLNDFYDKLEQL